MGNQNENDFPLFPEANMYSPQFPYNGMPNFQIEHDAAYAYPRTQEIYPASTGFDSTTMYSEVPQHFVESPELRGAAPSNYSTASGPSATSSTIGSPNSNHGHIVSVSEWGSGLGINPSIVNYDNFGQGTDYNFSAGMEDFTVDFNSAKPGFVDPSILHAPFSATRPTSAIGQSELSPYQAPMYPTSPSPSQHSSRSPGPVKADSASPYLGSQYYPYPPPMIRRPSLTISHQSYGSQEGNFSGEESKEKGRCTWPECGKIFKDLKAHMLTHQNERPEKCPIQTCDYHVKGFARKYDKNRHTLTHYKGTMVCGFCPGSGSAAEKSFNRADVFKRHLTSVHAVEQTPPNSRKKTSASINSGKKLSGYAPDATGKCSTCSATFSNAQDFYEHLDDCVLRIVQQEEPSEAINARRLAEVEQDHDVHETLRNNALPVTTNIYSTAEEDDEEEVDDENDDDYSIRARTSRKGRQNRNPINGVQKSRGMTHSKGGVTLNTKGRKKRKDYPSSWGCPTSQMKMKKRVLTVFDGPRRLWKDDMMLDTDYEVRIKLGDEKAYVTDLDVQTMRRAEAFHNATEEEKGPWIADDLTGMDLEKLMEVKREM
ncbi:putative zinc finger protein [Botrytis cinerea BcDW1]|nr:putative zinc finger protein [Botrytis cinerea BcDW1]